MAALAVPPSGGTGSPFASYEQQVIPRGQIPAQKPGEEAATLILQMRDFARHVCITLGMGHVMQPDGFRQMLRLSRKRFAPDAVHTVYQEVVRFSHFKRPDQTTSLRPLEFDVLRETFKGRMVMRGGFPMEFVSIPCAQSASLSKSEK